MKKKKIYSFIYFLPPFPRIRTKIIIIIKINHDSKKKKNVTEPPIRKTIKGVSKRILKKKGRREGGKKKGI